MYVGLSILEKWYRKYQHQYIEISGVVGTGTFDLIQAFIEVEQFDPREIMYLSFDQKQVIELASKQFHAYYINGMIYKYNREVNLDSLSVINPRSPSMEYQWKKSVRNKIDPKYKLIVVFDSLLMDGSMIGDLATFGLPIICIRDPMLLPSPDSYTYLRDANIILKEPHPDLIKNPINYFAHKVIMNDKLKPGNYDTVSIIPKKQMNLYNLKAVDMIIALNNNIRNGINKMYRERILKKHTSVTSIGEKLIVMNNLYAHKLVNPDEKKIKVYLTKGIVGNVTKIYKHPESTRYVYTEFSPEFYFDSFTDLMLDRYHLNGINAETRQITPDEIFYAEYAYALTPQLSRLSHWDKVTLVDANNEYDDPEFQTRLLYTGITRATHSLNIVI
jgi:hypothetical protein